jgi:hypothetical protein
MPVKYTAADGFTSEVGPQGKNPKTGEPYAKIGNILEYGRSENAKRRRYKSNQQKGKTSDMDSRGWFNKALKAAEAEVIAAMQEVIDSETRRGA